MTLKAFRDTGSLIIKDNSVLFQGGKGKVEIKNIKNVSYGKQGRDFVNNWVKIVYGDEDNLSTAFFTDGSSLGWGGVLGGTKKIFAVIQDIQNKI